MRILWFLFLACITVPSAAQNDTISVRGRVSPQLSVEFVGYRSAVQDARGDSRLTRIEVRLAGKRTQTLRFKEQDQPLFFRNDKSEYPIQLRDVDCDGLKDLLVRIGTGAQEAAYLFRFDADKHRFIEYRPFRTLSLKAVHCKSKTIETYRQAGQAGCAFQKGTYKWAAKELTPIEIEEQTMGDDEKFIRTITSWKNGKRLTTKLLISARQDCNMSTAEAKNLAFDTRH